MIITTTSDYYSNLFSDPCVSCGVPYAILLLPLLFFFTVQVGMAWKYAVEAKHVKGKVQGSFVQ